MAPAILGEGIFSVQKPPPLVKTLSRVLQCCEIKDRCKEFTANACKRKWEKNPPMRSKGIVTPPACQKRTFLSCP
jgi:hypothetical protein